MKPLPNFEIEQCPKCGSTERQTGRLQNGDAVAIQFVPHERITTDAISDSGQVHAILCPSCRYLEMYVPR